jgi:hypothetical protein
MTAPVTTAAEPQRLVDEFAYLDFTLQPAFDRIQPQRSRHEDAARSHVFRWVAEFRLASGPVLRRFQAADFPGFVAITYPSADETKLSLVTDWFAWLFLLDDALDDGPTGRDPDATDALMTSLASAILEPPDGSADAAPLATALADLWRRTTASAPDEWTRRFADHMAAGMAAASWESANRKSGQVPTPSRYIQQRRHTGAIYVCMDLIDIVTGLVVPAELYASASYQAALTAACDIVCWTNDVYSLDKETQLGEYHNLVSVVAHHERLHRPAALADVAHRIVTRLGQFYVAERQLLGTVEPDDRTVVAASLDGMRSWMRGNVEWSRRTRRYRDATARQR